MEKTYIRTATSEDFDRIYKVGVRSLADDPILTYFGCTKPNEKPSSNHGVALELYLSFLVHSCLQVGGIIDLLCLKSKETGEEEIAAVAVWLPPRKRVALWNVFVLLFSGIIALAEHIGTQGIWRLLWEFPAIVNESWRAACYSLDDPASWSLCQSWYLKLAFTAPKYQRKGNMSNLLQKRLSSTPGASFTLETTSTKLQQYFSRLDFEIMNRCRLGVGCVDEFGNPQEGGRGVEVMNMIKHR